MTTTYQRGDQITFRAATRSGAFTATRIVNGTSALGHPTVRYHGWSDFIVRPSEITDHQPIERASA